MTEKEKLQKEVATVEGKALLARMHGNGWKLRVWENAGWHYKVVNGLLSVNVSGMGETDKQYYFALLSRDGLGGEVFWTETKSYIDPNAAVRRQIKVAREFISGLTTVVDKVAKEIGLPQTRPKRAEEGLWGTFS